MKRSLRWTSFRVGACLVSIAGATHAADGQPAPTTSKSDLMTIVASVLKRIGVLGAPERDAFRDAPTASRNAKAEGTAGAGAIWTVARDGSRPRRLTPDTGYAWPVYAPDGGRVAALKAGQLVVVRPGAAEILIPLAPLPETPPKLLFAWTSRGISLLLSDLRAVLVDPTLGTVQDLGAVPAEAEATLLRSTRTCGKHYATSSSPPPDSLGKVGRSDVVLYTSVSADSEPAMYRGTLLTNRATSTRNLQPSFAPNCKRIAFVAEP